jgi:hypothetical protein
MQQENQSEKKLPPRTAQLRKNTKIWRKRAVVQRKQIYNDETKLNHNSKD